MYIYIYHNNEICVCLHNIYDPKAWVSDSCDVMI